MIRLVTYQDIDQWEELASEVEPLFGEMVGLSNFQDGIKSCICSSSALCLTAEHNEILGIIAFSKETNEILWFAIKKTFRGKGYGHQMLKAAIEHLDRSKPIYVQTFSHNFNPGEPARRLYMHFGFIDYQYDEKKPRVLIQQSWF